MIPASIGWRWAVVFGGSARTIMYLSDGTSTWLAALSTRSRIMLRDVRSISASHFLRYVVHMSPHIQAFALTLYSTGRVATLTPWRHLGRADLPMTRGRSFTVPIAQNSIVKQSDQ